MHATTSKPIRWHTTEMILLLILSLSLIERINSFAPVIQQPIVAITRRNMEIYLKNDLFTDVSVPIRTTDGVHTSVIPTMKNHQVMDKNGNEFTVDSVVRVSSDGIKAFQVNSKGQGYYNDKKDFVPDKSDSKKKSLVLPIGLRGIVKRVYDEDVISSNLPILVVFNPNENMEEGYNAPTKFLMHFTPFEVEVVV